MTSLPLTIGSRVRAPGRSVAWTAALGAVLLVYGAWQVLRYAPIDGAIVGDAFFFPVSAAAVWTAWRASRRTRCWRGLGRAWRLVVHGRLVKALGVRVAVDDFGTGYSSLAYRRQFPVDALKIDRAFGAGIAVSDHAAALLHTLVKLGKILGLEVVGERIETEGQLRQLRLEQCDVGQGFLLSRPLAAGETENLLAEQFAPDDSVVLRLAIGETTDALELDPADAVAI